jgi:hypothetical protein
MVTEWIILADYVEFTSGKLYLMGGGWDQLTINHPAKVHNFGIAAAFRVEGHESDLPHDVTLTVTLEADTEPLIELQAHLELASGSDLTPESSQLAQLALNLSVEFKTQGCHHLVTTIDGREDRRFPFTVHFGRGILE